MEGDDPPVAFFLSRTTPAGESAVARYEDGLLAAVERTSGDDAERYLYKYGGGDNSARIISVTLRRKVDSVWKNIRRANYSYYGEGDANGAPGDLRTVIYQKPTGAATWSDEGTCYYRYYATTGFVHGLKFALDPQSFASLAAVHDPLTAGNEIVAQFADHYFEYDGQGRVTKETVAGGTQTYTLSYQTSDFDWGLEESANGDPQIIPPEA